MARVQLRGIVKSGDRLAVIGLRLGRGAVGVALARSRAHAFAGVLGLDAVPRSQFAQLAEQGSYRSASMSWSAWSR